MFKTVTPKQTSQTAMNTGSGPNKLRQYEQCNVKLENISGTKLGDI
jgi:hypothetical protein